MSSYFKDIENIDPDQITFEKIAYGTLINSAHLSHNLCIYGTNGKAQMNKRTILRMNDAGRWFHDTVKSTNFNLPDLHI